MRKIALLLALCLLTTAVVTPAAATDRSPILNRILERGEFRVAMSGAQPPFSVTAKDGKIIGFEVSIAQLLADAMDVDLKIVQVDFPDLLSTLEKGDVDAVMSGMTMTLERNKRAAFLGPYLLSGKSILTKDKTLAAIRDADELSRPTIILAALEGSTGQKFVKAMMPKAQLVTTRNYDEAVQMILDDEITALVADFPICALSVMRHGDKGLVTLTEPLSIEPIGMAIAPGDSHFLNLIENYLAFLQVSGALERLEQRWFEDGSWLAALPN